MMIKRRTRRKRRKKTLLLLPRLPPRNEPPCNVNLHEIR
jgi:hypothetical protein